MKLTENMIRTIVRNVIIEQGYSSYRMAGEKTGLHKAMESVGLDPNDNQHKSHVNIVLGSKTHDDFDYNIFKLLSKHPTIGDAGTSVDDKLELLGLVFEPFVVLQPL